MSSQKVSVITVVFNAAQLLKETIESIRSQSYQNIEYFVIDGGSTDGTLQVIEANSDIISSYVSEKDAGIYDAMNKGIAYATGDWTIFLNAGDKFVDGETLSKVICNVANGPKLVYGSVLLSGNGNTNRLEPKSLSFFSLLFWGTRTLCHQSLLVHRDILINYNSNYILKGELDWYFRLIGHENYTYAQQLDFPVAEYLLGGVGQKKFVRNLVETIIVLTRHGGPLAIISLPVLIYRLLKY
ncbi:MULTISPECIES: glycosyltransferase family 2 protein [unclassified Imperialibacter]|uniref:glycosyltransferase family 2 protein n=1 Tax=unclassified Imperialibacter TaxID=2629706 RepID=UPI00125B41B2